MIIILIVQLPTPGRWGKRVLKIKIALSRVRTIFILGRKRIILVRNSLES